MKTQYIVNLLVSLAFAMITTFLCAQKAYDTLPFFSYDISSAKAETEFTALINSSINVSSSKAESYAKTYLQYALDVKDSTLLMSAYQSLGMVFFKESKLDSAMVIFNSALKLAEDQADSTAKMNITRAIGSVYLEIKQNQFAIERFNESYELAKTIEDSIGMAKALNNLSLISARAGEYENALNFLRRSLDLKIAFAPKSEQITTLINIGDNYLKLNNTAKASEYYDRAENIATEFNQQRKMAMLWAHRAQVYIINKDYPTVQKCFDKSLELAHTLNDPGQIANVLKGYGEFWMLVKNYEKAESKFLAVLDLKNTQHNPVFLTELYLNLGKIDYKKKDYDNALNWLNKAIGITGVENKDAIAEALNLESVINYIDGDLEMAYHNLRISNLLEDSIQKNRDADKLRELQIKYNAVNDKKNIENLLEVSEVKEQERKKSKVYFIISFSLFVLTLGAALALARQVNINKKKSVELETQMEENAKKTEDLIEAHKNAEEGLRVKSEFIAMVSHEIRTPMNAIIGMSSLLSDTELTKQQSNYLNNISISSNNLLILLNDILDFSRVEAGTIKINLQPTNILRDLHHVVDMFQPLAQEKNLDFQVDLDDNIPEFVFVDGPRLRQVIVNLLNNAIKFTHEGFVKLTVKKTGSEPTLNGFKVTLKFTIEDSGIGVSQEKQNEIFASFNQLDSKVSRVYAGVGLGLSISQGILSMMDSTVELESEFAKGSTFGFSLVVKSDESKPTQNAESSASFSKVKFDKELGISCPMKILIAEDNEINQKLLKHNLNKMGYNPSLVSNGQEVLDKIKNENFDLIFMDIQMPVMDGVSATKEIVRTYGTDKPIIVAVTANAIGTDKQSYIQAGMDDYISKPFTTKEIEECLRSWYVHLNN